MKVFTLTEANAMLRDVEPMIREISRHYGVVSRFRDESHAAAGGAESGGGGMEGGAAYVSSVTRLGELTSELSNLGVQLKDYARGLIDFPTMRDGRVVFLCWQLGEGPEIEWWHEVEDGFAGRRRL